MLTIPEIAAVVAATKGAVDIFDKIGGQIKSVLLKRSKEADGDEERWRFKISGQEDTITVKQSGQTIQTITANDIANVLGPRDLELIRTYEKKMEEYFTFWRAVYAAKDSSQDPLINAKTDAQLNNLIVKMRAELIGILDFLRKLGVHLDDHYMHIRHLVETSSAANA